jgi:hypothetical protein
MKKLLIITLLFSNFSTFAFDDGSDKIIKKYLKAIGGAKEWDAVNTLKIVRHIDERSFADFTEVIYVLKNVGYREEHLFIVGSPALKGYYNNEAWGVSNPFLVLNGNNESDSTNLKNNKTYQKKQVRLNENNGLEISLKKLDYDTVSFKNIKFKPKDQIRNIYNNEMILLKWKTQMPWNFIDYEAKGYKATYKGDSKISVDEVAEIEMVSETGDTTNYFFDKKRFILLKATRKNMEFTFSNYKQVDNIKIPFEIIENITDHKFPNSTTITPIMTWYIIDQVKLNEPMDESIFMKPKQ